MIAKKTFFMRPIDKCMIWVVLLAAMAVPTGLQAQKQQEPDTLEWNGKRYLLLVERDVPTPLMVYYQRTMQETPFQYWSSSNSRGHTAHYELTNETLYLTRIAAKRYRTRDDNLWAASGIDTVVGPEYFGIKPFGQVQPYGEGPVAADWYSGVVELKLIATDKKERKSEEALGRRLLQVKDGKVVQNLLVSEKEQKALQRLTPGEAASGVLGTKQALLEMQRRFNNYYVRCGSDRESVRYQGHEGLMAQRRNRLTLVMELWGNDPMRCGSHWEKATADHGAPFGRWLISGDSIYLSEVSTHNGDSLYPYDSHPQPLTPYLGMEAEAAHEGRGVFAHWLDGTYEIHYGAWEENSFGVRNYNVSKTQKVRVKEGKVISSQFSPSSFEEDSIRQTANHYTICDESNIWSVEDKQLSAAVGSYKKPKKAPRYQSDKGGMRGYFASRSLTDERAKERLFRVRIGFMVNCKGEAGEWRLLNANRGELFEFANMVLDMVKQMPQRWLPAEDKKGQPVDCWQVIEFTVSNGSLTNADYK